MMISYHNINCRNTTFTISMIIAAPLIKQKTKTTKMLKLLECLQLMMVMSLLNVGMAKKYGIQKIIRLVGQIEMEMYGFLLDRMRIEDHIGMFKTPMAVIKMLCLEDAFLEKKNKIIQLICKEVKFYALKDEDAFFEWLTKINCITNISAIGDALYLDLPYVI